MIAISSQTQQSRRAFINADLLWSKRDVKRFAAVYNRRIESNPTKTRVVKSQFFNYILNNWDRLQERGTIRCVPNEAFSWVENPKDEIFSPNYA